MVLNLLPKIPQDTPSGITLLFLIAKFNLTQEDYSIKQEPFEFSFKKEGKKS